MALLPIARMGEPVLRTPARPVTPEELESPAFQAFIDDLIETCRAASGAGIAAPQVFDPRRVFLIEVQANARYPDVPDMPLTVVINPEVTWLGDDRQYVWEGCLSIPDLRGRVPRHARVQLRGLDREGQPIDIELQGFHAAVAQHELDHLDGVLFPDRMEDLSTLAFLAEWTQHVQPTLTSRVEPAPPR